MQTLSKIEDLQRLVDSAVKTFGAGSDIMVNTRRRRTRTLSSTPRRRRPVRPRGEPQERLFRGQVAAKQMIAQGGGGRMINMTSVHEDLPMPGNTAYFLSKRWACACTLTRSARASSWPRMGSR